MRTLPLLLIHSYISNPCMSVGSTACLFSSNGKIPTSLSTRRYGMALRIQGSTATFGASGYTRVLAAFLNNDYSLMAAIGVERPHVIGIFEFVNKWLHFLYSPSLTQLQVVRQVYLFQQLPLTASRNALHEWDTFREYAGRQLNLADNLLN